MPDEKYERGLLQEERAPVPGELDVSLERACRYVASRYKHLAIRAVTPCYA